MEKPIVFIFFFLSVSIQSFISFASLAKFRTRAELSMSPPLTLLDGDLVEYLYTFNETTLGAVVHFKSSLKLTPLCIRDKLNDFEGSDTFLYEDDTKDFISISNVTVIQVIDDTVFTQRIVEDRISNPHGEHAENVWIVKKSKLEELLVNPSFSLVVDRFYENQQICRYSKDGLTDKMVTLPHLVRKMDIMSRWHKELAIDVLVVKLALDPYWIR